MVNSPWNETDCTHGRPVVVMSVAVPTTSLSDIVNNQMYRTDTRGPARLCAGVVVLPTNPKDEQVEGRVHSYARTGCSWLGIVGDGRE